MKKTLLIAALVLPVVAFAQEAQPFVPLTNLPGINEAAASSTLPSFFNNLYKLCIGAAAVIAILQIMRAGMYFMFNKGSIAHNEKGKKLITDSVLGLLLVLSPVIVFGIINPDILDLKLDFDQFELGAIEADPSSPLSVRLLKTVQPPLDRNEVDPADQDRVASFQTGCRDQGGTSGYTLVSQTPVRCSNEAEDTANPGCLNARVTCQLPSTAEVITGTTLQSACRVMFDAIGHVGPGESCPVQSDSLEIGAYCCPSNIPTGSRCCGKPKFTQQIVVLQNMEGTLDASEVPDPADRQKANEFEQTCERADGVVKVRKSTLSVRCPQGAPIAADCVNATLYCAANPAGRSGSGQI